ncbi:acetylcholine receptor subunit alpha-like 2 [Mytilus trossulus]|uniref:acetylcholine receptor subunit alpha-like 2 n=1 Tax=Mytilus trossulus TaxID=6551 RepID=UPI00300724EE
MNLKSAAVYLTMCVFTITGQNLEEAKLLHSDLLKDYKPSVRPVLNQSESLHVNVTFYLTSFNSFNQVDETISLTMGTTLTWKDPSLVWDPASYGNITSTTLDSINIWTPLIFLLNSAENLNTIGSDAKYPCTVFYTGMVIHPPGGLISAKCPTDVSKFPFDTQTCTLIIIPWGMSSSQVTLTSVYSEAQLGFYTPHADWTLLERKTSVGLSDGNYSAFYLNMKFQRQSLYFNILIIIPTLLFASLNPLVFVLPVDSGERVSLAMTILLSYVIFLTLVSGSIPATSNPMCALLLIMIVIISISGLIVIGTIYSAKYYYLHTDEHMGFLPIFFAKRLILRRGKIVPNVDEQEYVITGKDASRALDTVFFFSTYSAIIICVICYFIYVSF